MLSVTLKQLRDNDACVHGYNTLVCSLKQIIHQRTYDRCYIDFEYNEPILLSYILKSNDITDAIWVLNCFKEHKKEIRLFALSIVEMSLKYRNDVDKRCYDAIAVAKLHATGHATDEELKVSVYSVYNECDDAEYAFDVYTATWPSFDSLDVFVYNTINNIDKQSNRFRLELESAFIELCEKLD